jgi:putative transposase
MSSTFKKRKSNRLKVYDYSENGYYFVTLCTENGKEYFGKIENEKMILNRYGEIAERFWKEIPEHYDKAEMDEYIIMPNHIHGILIINNEKDVRTERCSVPTNTKRSYGLLSKIIKSFKNAVTMEVYRKSNDGNFRWQRSFYDHVIRNEESLYEIRKYITQNPLKWELEKNNIESLPSFLCSTSKK